MRLQVPKPLVVISVISIVTATAACSSSHTRPAADGHIIVALTIDWEGASLDADALAALDRVRAQLGPVPITHFVSAAYFTKRQAAPDVAAKIAGAIRPGDELAVHLHMWESLARRAGLTPKLSPSFLTGDDDVVDLDGDKGFETDPDVYDVSGLRALLRLSRQLLEQTHVRVSHSFRAGGYLTTPKVLLALGDEGFEVDSSAIDYRQLRDLDEDNMPKRISELWPGIERGSQPFVIRGGAMQPMIELPIAAVADYLPTSEIVGALDSAHARLAAQPTRNVYVVLGFHLETGPDFNARIAEALASVRARYGDELRYATVEQAAELVSVDLPTGT